MGDGVQPAEFWVIAPGVGLGQVPVGGRLEGTTIPITRIHQPGQDQRREGSCLDVSGLQAGQGGLLDDLVVVGEPPLGDALREPLVRPAVSDRRVR